MYSRKQHTSEGSGRQGKHQKILIAGSLYLALSEMGWGTIHHEDECVLKHFKDFTKEAAVLQPVLPRTDRTVSGCRDNHRNSASKPRNPLQKLHSLGVSKRNLGEEGFRALSIFSTGLGTGPLFNTPNRDGTFHDIFLSICACGNYVRVNSCLWSDLTKSAPALQISGKFAQTPML